MGYNRCFQNVLLFWINIIVSVCWLYFAQLINLKMIYNTESETNFPSDKDKVIFKQGTMQLASRKVIGNMF